MFTGSGGLGYLLVLLLPFALLIFIVFSQRRRGQQVQALQASLAVGDEVVTTSGLYGTIVALDDAVVTLDTGAGQTVRYDRRAIGMRAPEVA
jgi:preprotein translocase subunit YajC